MTDIPDKADRTRHKEPQGEPITCIRCNGIGVIQARNSLEPWPEECPSCNGSGKNWRYPQGAIAKHYAGPLISKEPRS